MQQAGQEVVMTDTIWGAFDMGLCFVELSQNQGRFRKTAPFQL
jgi:hypothetical protein